MKCKTCQFQNPPGMRFCGMCGTRLDVDRGSDTTVSDTISGDYTPSFLKESVLSSTGAVRGERKRVTVLFADIVGFTTIAEQMDPEDVHAIVNGCFLVFADEIHQAAGTINQYTGDGVMALFGAPVAYENHVRSACRAALAIASRFREYAKSVARQYDVDLNLRMGIHTGPVVVGVIGSEWRRDYTAVGDTTNVAARLQTRARPGTILVSDRVRRAVAGHFVFEDAGLMELKGKTQPVGAFVLKDVAAAVQTAAASATTFVARRPQLEGLQGAFADVVAGNCTMAAVIGEAGMGKSALVEQFANTSGPQAALVLRGQGKPYAKSSALVPVLDMLHTVLGGENGTRFTSHQENGRTTGAGQGPRKKLAALIAQFDNLGIGHLRSTVLSKARRRLLFDALCELLAATAAIRPVVLVIEDLQWVDGATLSLMGEIRKRMAHHPVMIVLTGRYERPDELPCRADRILALPPLDRQASRQLLSLTIGTDRLADRVREQLLAVAGGNPLFITEIGAALKQGDVLHCDQDRCTLRGSVDELEIPESLQAVLSARLDALSQDLKLIVQLAAVIGEAFSADLVAMIIGWSAKRVAAALQALKQNGILDEQDLDGRPQYRFRQQMMREVAYGALLHQDRRRWHWQVATAGESVAGKHVRERAGFLSYHFWQAGDWPKAFTHTLEAALAAQQSHSVHEVLTNLERALQVLRRGRFEHAGLMALDLYLWQGRMLYAVGQLAAAQASFERMLNEATALDDTSGRAEAMFRMGWLAFYQHQPERATALLEDAMALSRQEGLDEIMLKAGGFLGFVLAVLGQLDRARPLLNEALRSSLEHGSNRARAWSLSHLLRYCSWTGEFDRALEYGAELEKLNRQIASPYFSLMHNLILGQICGSIGRLKAARQYLRAGLRQLGSSEDRFWRPRYLNTLGWIAALEGKLTTARHLNRQSARLAQKAGDPECYYNARINLGENYLDGGDIHNARRVLEDCWQQVAHERAPYARWRYKTRLLIHLARLQQALGQRTKGLRYARRALQMARQSGAVVQQVRALMIKGRLLTAKRPALARKDLFEALALARRVRVDALAQRVRCELEQVGA